MRVGVYYIVFMALVGVLFERASSAQPHIVNIEKELMVTDLAVVNHASEALDPTGAFHIKSLLDAMAPCDGSAKDVLLSFVNGMEEDLPDRPRRNIRNRLINGWKRWKPDGTQIPLAQIPDDKDWVVNWEKAPFRLLAIVNRIDLKENPNIGNAGEGRFVFCTVDPNNPETGPAQSCTIILEYFQPAKSAADVEDFAKAWHQLGTFSAFDAAYIDALKKVTQRFAGRNAMRGQTNHSALAQLRTNDIEFNPLSGPGWELREFVLGRESGLLEPATVKLTPHHAINNSEFLSFLVRQNGLGLSDNLPSATLDFRAITGFDPSFQWNAPGLTTSQEKQALRKFSVNTCSGCHGGDARTTDVAGFYQVAPRGHNVKSQLSTFLSDQPSSSPGVVDPSTGLHDTKFSDLANRQLFLSAIVGAPLPPVPSATTSNPGMGLQRILRIREALRKRVH